MSRVNNPRQFKIGTTPVVGGTADCILFIDSGGDVSQDTNFKFDGTDQKMGDSTAIKFGAGGLAGALGCDMSIESDGTEAVVTIESPSGIWTNPTIEFTYYDLYQDGNFHVPKISFDTTSGIGVIDKNLYVMDTTGTDSAQIIVTAHDFGIGNVNDLARFRYEATQVNLEISAPESGSTIELDAQSHTYTVVDFKIQADSKKLYFGAADDASITYDGTNLHIDSQEVGSGHIILDSPKTTTGDPTGAEGMIYWNTVDNVIKMYADGAWRTLASW